MTRGFYKVQETINCIYSNVWTLIKQLKHYLIKIVKNRVIVEKENAVDWLISGKKALKKKYKYVLNKINFYLRVHLTLNISFTNALNHLHLLQ